MRISDDVVFRDLAGEVVLLNLATGTYFGLDAVGTRIWHLIAEHGSKETVIDALLAEYEVADDQLRRDLDDLIGRLREQGLLAIHAEDTLPSA